MQGAVRGRSRAAGRLDLVRSGRLALGYRNARIREIAGAEYDAVLLAGSMDAGPDQCPARTLPSPGLS
jgi:hypothetical protein